MVDLTVVIPYYNGFNNLCPLLEKLIPTLESLNLKWEILFIDDHSCDNGFDFLKKQHLLDTRINVIRLLKNRGQQNAIFCGLLNASGSLIITMDDDLQHPTEIVVKLINKIKEGYDVVYAVDRSRDKLISLRIGTWLNSQFFTIFLKKPRKIEIGSYRIMSKEFINKFRSINTNFIYISALIFNFKPKVYSFRYKPIVKPDITKSRIKLKNRFILFLRLFNNYGPFKFITKEKGEPFRIEETT